MANAQELEEYKKTIEESGLFDSKYYVREYKDVRQAKELPLEHFVKFGLDEDRKPNAGFDPVWYREHYTDVKEAGLYPFIHYVIYGLKEFRFANENEKKEYENLKEDGFDVEFYKNNYDDIKIFGEKFDFLLHYIRNGQHEGREIKKVKFENLFDINYYIKNTPDVKTTNLTPIEHYKMRGYKEGRNPNPFFDTNWYKSQYPEVENENPLVHYITKGWKEGNNPSYKFDVNKYLENYPEVKKDNIEPLKHFLTEGKDKGYVSFRVDYQNQDCQTILDSGLFMFDWVETIYQDLIQQDSLLHYCIFGHKEGRNPNPFFDTNWYKSQYPEVENENPLVHYITKGWKEGNNPSYKFDVNKYLENYPEVKKDNIEPLKHFLTEGKDKGYVSFRVDYQNQDCQTILDSGCFMFDWVETIYQDLIQQDSLLHYCIFGHKEGRNPNPFFDTNWYKSQYPEVENENPLVHYITKGWKEGNNPSYKFDVNKYLENYPEVKKDNIEPLKHFLTEGKDKGYKVYPVNSDTILSINSKSSFSKKLFPDLGILFDYNIKKLAPLSMKFNKKCLNIHFVIPDFGIGGGGHMNIFRMIRLLEMFGHNLTIWIFDPSIHKDEKTAYEDIIKYYSTIKANVKFIYKDFQKTAKGDVIFASSWNTVWPVQSAKYFKRRFYFIQDYETLFNAKGSRSELAEYTYTQDLDCICASTWLQSLMEKKFNRWARSFNLAADKDIYNPRLREANKIPRIVLYSRIFTERRGVELALIALELLAKEGVKFHVDMFGADFHNIDSAPFSCSVFYKRTPEELADLYNKSDIGLVFSLTNYSLVPQEMMACDLAIVEFDTESTRAIYPDNIVTFSGPSPIDIKEKIKYLLLNPNARKKQVMNAKKWLKQFSWIKSAREIEKAILDRLAEHNFEAIETYKKEKIKASIIIPTYNGGELFKTVLVALQNQITPWKYEIIVLDSESTDGTAEYLKSIDNIIYKTIKKEDFNHGATRNYGVEISQGEYIAFITQDAIPTHNHWLYNFVTMLEHYPNAAGAFGKHIAHDDASTFTKRELREHFNNFLNFPLSVSLKSKIPDGYDEKSWMGILHFYSDNNSCFRKSIWKKIPYRNVQYGEDQLWADDIIKKGYEKLYVPTAVVKHSHEYAPKTTYERAKTDADFFKYYWGYQLIDSDKKDHIVKELIKNDIIFALENALPKKEINDRIASIKAKFQGYLDGYNKDVSMFSKESKEKSKF
ncbi:glycosyltransferase [Sulfurimonas sediminis]|uniref:Glycosyltransferase n=1 Tax=Sulfurimonas sediminis TaxID=2590020 RepID=A0A7M1AZ00_9BACT|nr:glycosyltransferase [Sulfurimonas sediminis]QOP42673.1 glycosyltransferase [Sulfurimonas sediminis]